MKSRELFSDGLNSFWHVFFGLLSIRFLVIIPIFVIYQLINIYDTNLFVDLAEFFIGFFAISLFVSFFNYHKVNYFIVDQSFLKYF